MMTHSPVAPQAQAQPQPQPAPRVDHAFKFAGMRWDWYHLPLLIAFGSFLFTPFLISTVGAPSAIRWVGDAAVALMLALAMLRMLVANRVPGIIPAILALSAIGFTVALFEGQSLLATAWGWWLMFRYPFVALFVYLAPRWPANFANWLPRMCLAILGLQVVVQAIQYAGGESNVDHISGTFGRFGTGSLVLFIILALSIGFGRWIARNQWGFLLLVLILSIISSVLGEMKLFLIAFVVLSGLALFLITLRGQQVYRAFLYLAVFIGAILVFSFLYNMFLASIIGARIEEYVFETNVTERYLGFATVEGGRSQFGRNFAIGYGWKTIQRDPTTFLFGMGLGTRSESESIGLVGQGLRQSYYGVFVGSSLLVMMQEMGLIGLVALSIFILWTVLGLLRAIGRDPHSDISALRYACILYSLCWPIWLWYNTAWALHVPALLYWTMIGFVFRYSPSLPGSLRPLAVTTTIDRHNGRIKA